MKPWNGLNRDLSGDRGAAHLQHQFWDRHVLLFLRCQAMATIGGAPWARTWANRTAYVHLYANAYRPGPGPRVEDHHAAAYDHPGEHPQEGVAEHCHGDISRSPDAAEILYNCFTHGGPHL